MRMDSRDIMNTASSWPYGWPMGTYSPCLIEESKGENGLSFCLHGNFFHGLVFYSCKLGRMTILSKTNAYA